MFGPIFLACLNFDASEILREVKEDIRPVNKATEAAKYFHWVDQVVNSHKAHAIDEFLVRFNVRKNFPENVDNWLKFAVNMRVKRLELHLAIRNEMHWISYSFPSLPPLYTLTSLKLGYVDVNAEVLQKFLSDCPNLEVLSVIASKSLVDFRVVGPYKLKLLKVSHCENMERLEISVTNITKLVYKGGEINASLENAPNLTELRVMGFWQGKLLHDFSGLSSCISRLEKLTLTNVVYIEWVAQMFPVAPRLKILEVRSVPFNAGELFAFISIIKSCPSLHKFVIQIDIIREREVTEMVRRAEVLPHDKLKILEIRRFNGCDLSILFVNHLIKTFVSVEKVTIKADTYYEGSDTTPRLKAKKEAERLASLFKAGTDVQIICPETEYCYK